MLRWFKKTLFIFLCFGLLAVALFFFLEVAARLYQSHIEKHNPFIIAANKGEELPYREIRTENNFQSLLAPKKQESDRKNESELKLHPDTRILLNDWLDSKGFSPEKRMKLREDFRSWSTQTREYYTCLTHEAVIVFNAENNIRNFFGSDASYFEGYQRSITLAYLHQTGILGKIYEALKEVRHTNKAVTLKLPWSERIPGSPVFTAYCLPGIRTGSGWAYDYLFVCLHPDEISRQDSTEIDSSSEWEKKHFRYKPDFQRDSEGTFDTNSHGFRDQERKMPKERGTFRILCIGDDATIEGSHNNRTYPARMEQKLSATFPDKNIEVINAGIAGITACDMTQRFFDYASLEPDLVLLQPGASDLLHLYNTRWTNFLPSMSVAARLLFPGIFAPSVSAFTDSLKRSQGTALEVLCFAFTHINIPVMLLALPYPDWNKMTRGERQFLEWQSKSALFFPAFSLSEYTDFVKTENSLLEEKAARYHIPFIPMEKGLKEDPAFFGDCFHLTQKGIERKADMACAILEPIIEKGYSAE